MYAVNSLGRTAVFTELVVPDTASNKALILVAWQTPEVLEIRVTHEARVGAAGRCQNTYQWLVTAAYMGASYELGAHRA